MAVKRGIAAAMVLGLVVSACDDGSSSVLDGDSPARVDDVLDAAGDAAGDAISVSGSLLLQLEGGGPALLCDAPLDSRPPKCGAPGLPVVGIDVAEMPDADTGLDVAWVDDVTLEGRLVAGRVDVPEELTDTVDGQSGVDVHLRHDGAK